ncbi:MAG: glycosyltransferase family 2 protein [Ilumatobacteraceae bacterium]
MSRFLFATSGRGATLDMLAATSRSIGKLGPSRHPWYVTGTKGDVSTLVMRRRAPLSGRVTLGDDASCEWVVFLAAGDSVTRDALRIAGTAIDNVGPDVDVIYGDTRHDIKRDDRLPTYQRRPSFSPERLRSHNYIGEFIMAKRSLVDSVGGLAMLTDTNSHDRNLRLTERARRVLRSPVILNVTPSGNLLPDANVDAVAQHLARRAIAADVVFDADTPAVRVRRRLQHQPKISVVIPTRGSSAELRGVSTPFVVNAVRTLVERSTYQNFEIIVVADTPTPAAVRAELSEIGGNRLLIVDYDKAFNFAVKNNIGVAHSNGEFVLLLNDDTELISPDALETMLALFEDGNVGIVGPILYFEDGTIQSAGHVFTPDPTDMYRLQPATIRGAHNYVRVQREASSVIAACLLTPRTVFEAVGGLSTQFPGNWNDIDYALKVQQAGYSVIFTPHAEFFHFESKTRVALRIESEVAKLGNRWGDILDDDPYFNPRLQRFINMWRSDFHTDRSYEEALGPTAPISSK